MEKRLSLPDVSLEIPLYDYGEETFADLARSDDNIEDEAAGRGKKEILERKVAEFRQTLNDEKLFIFNHRAMAEEPTTLQQIGLRFRISRERVRQIEHKVLKRFGEILPSLRSRIGCFPIASVFRNRRGGSLAGALKANHLHNPCAAVLSGRGAVRSRCGHDPVFCDVAVSCGTSSITSAGVRHGIVRFSGAEQQIYGARGGGRTAVHGRSGP